MDLEDVPHSSIPEVFSCGELGTTGTSECGSGYFEVLPDEILLQIFPHLDGATFIRCRRVSKRWKVIVDDMQQRRETWEHFCKKDYSDVYASTLRSCDPCMNWFQIYRNLYLWPRITTAHCTYHQIGPDRFFSINNFDVSKAGIVSVVTTNNIQFYDLKTLKLYKGTLIAGKYNSYQENERARIVLGTDDRLYITRKSLITGMVEDGALVECVKAVFLDEKYIYYQNKEGDIYKYDLFSQGTTPKHLTKLEGLMGGMYAFKDNLYIKSEDMICISNDNEVSRITQYNLQHLAGVLGTYSPLYTNYSGRGQKCMHVLGLIFKEDMRLFQEPKLTADNFDKFINELTGEIPPSSINLLRREYITCARVYNDMIIIGSDIGVLYVVKMDGFQELRHFQLPLPFGGICDIRVHERDDGYDLLISTSSSIHIIKIFHDRTLRST